MSKARRPLQKKKRRKNRQDNPLVRMICAGVLVALLVVMCAVLTRALPSVNQETQPASAAFAAQDAPTPVPTPTPEPTITPTPAIYAPFGAQFGHGGAELIPETPVPDITPAPSQAPTPQPTPKPTAAPTQAPSRRTLKKGMKGNDVKALQQALIDLGYLNDTADGAFGQNTYNAVVAFQAVNGLSADGIAGEKTLTLIESGNALAASEAPPMDYLLLVNRDNPLDKNYAPTDLVKIADVIPSDVLKVKYKGTRANRTAVEALGHMLQDAVDQGITDWQVSSAYRSYADQQSLVDDSVRGFKERNPSWSRARCLSATYQTVAPAGTSEHMTGLAFDITVPGVSFSGTPQQKWLHEHCYEYGFIVRFTKEKEAITGFLAESWHFRYVGTAAAAVITYNDWCLEEYAEKMGL